MDTKRLTHTLLVAGAVSALAASPALAQGGHGGPRGGDDSLLENDLSLTSTLAISSPGTSSTRTLTDRDGESVTVTRVRGARAAGAVTSDITTASGASPGDLAGALKYTTRTSGSRGSFSGILTVSSSGGKLRLRIAGRSDGNGSYEADVRRAKGSGDFADANVDGDVDVTVSADSVAIDLDGQFDYDDASDASSGGRGEDGGGRRGDCPRGEDSSRGSGDSGSNDDRSASGSRR